jgi:Holin of 3TMs, for gene-transfer release
MAVLNNSFDIGSLFSGIGDAAQKIRGAIINDIPAEKQAELQAKYAELEQQLALAQAQINQAEAVNTNIFISGWRPLAGWICDFGLALSVLRIIAVPVCKVFWPEIIIPEIDTGTVVTLLMSMLGLGTMRTMEKIQGAQGNH